MDAVRSLALRPTSAHLAAAGVLLTLLVAPVASARAEADNKRKVAVLEYRSGSSALPDVGPRLAAMLGEKTSLAVVDVAQARRQLGRDLDRKVARCAGAAKCIARIGKKLDVREILLVGVSRFGDEIITLQRIDVAKRRVITRIADAMAAGEEPDAEALLGYLQNVLPKSDFLRYGTLRVESETAGAVVEVNGEQRGETPLAPLRVRAPASYDIRVEKAGFNPFVAAVEVPPEGVVRVRASLVRRGGQPWYKRWWVVALAGGVVVGATAAVIATRDAPPDLPVTIRF